MIQKEAMKLSATNFLLQRWKINNYMGRYREMSNIAILIQEKLKFQYLGAPIIFWLVVS